MSNDSRQKMFLVARFRSYILPPVIVTENVVRDRVVDVLVVEDGGLVVKDKIIHNSRQEWEGGHGEQDTETDHQTRIHSSKILPQTQDVVFYHC